MPQFVKVVYEGSLRKTCFVRTFKPAMTKRSGPGAYTVLLPLRNAVTITFATSSGSVVMGASGKCVVILVRTMPGRTINTCAPVPASAASRPWANASSPLLLTRTQNLTDAPGHLRRWKEPQECRALDS